MPDRIFQVNAIPYTLTGKKMEVPVRRILMGVPAEKAANRAAMANVQSLDYFVEYARTQRDYSMVVCVVSGFSRTTRSVWLQPDEHVVSGFSRTTCADATMCADDDHAARTHSAFMADAVVRISAGPIE